MRNIMFFVRTEIRTYRRLERLVLLFYRNLGDIILNFHLEPMLFIGMNYFAPWTFNVTPK